MALVGEAAHLMPPIGAQGLNLGLRDAAAVGELATAAHRAGRDIGAEDLIGRYESMRRADIMSRTLAVDLVNQSLLSDFIPLQAGRGLALFLMRRIGPLRRSRVPSEVSERMAAWVSRPPRLLSAGSDTRWKSPPA